MRTERKTTKMFEMKAAYCNYYKIENGRELCSLTKTTPTHCRSCSYFKSELYTPTEDERGLFSADKFKLVEIVKKCPGEIRIKMSRDKVAISKKAAETLCFPEYVQIFEAESRKQIAVKKCTKESKGAMRVAKSKDAVCVIYSRGLSSKLSEYGSAANGEYDSANNTIIFTFSKKG